MTLVVAYASTNSTARMLGLANWALEFGPALGSVISSYNVGLDWYFCWRYSYPQPVVLSAVLLGTYNVYKVVLLVA